MQRTSPAGTGLDGARHLRAAHYLYPRVLRHGSIFRLTFFFILPSCLSSIYPKKIK